MSGCREGRPQPEIVANNFRLYNPQRSLGMTVTQRFTSTFLNFHLEGGNTCNSNVNRRLAKDRNA